MTDNKNKKIEKKPTGKAQRFIVTFLILSSVIYHLSACGFTPMYGKSAGKSAPQEYLAQIEIGNIPNREGQQLRNALIDRFYRNGRPQNTLYTLSISEIDENLTDLDITKTDDSTRGQLQLSSTISLADKRTGQILITRDLTSITSYNILAGEFATRVSEQNARENALKDLARQIELQLGLYFRR